MQSITCRYILVRTTVRTNQSTIILQSDDYNEMVQLKGILESELPLELFRPFKYAIKEKRGMQMENQ